MLIQCYVSKLISSVYCSIKVVASESNGGDPRVLVCHFDGVAAPWFLHLCEVEKDFPKTPGIIRLSTSIRSDYTKPIPYNLNFRLARAIIKEYATYANNDVTKSEIQTFPHYIKYREHIDTISVPSVRVAMGILIRDHLPPRSSIIPVPINDQPAVPEGVLDILTGMHVDMINRLTVCRSLSSAEAAEKILCHRAVSVDELNTDSFRLDLYHIVVIEEGIEIDERFKGKTVISIKKF